MAEAMKGYILQTIFYHITGDPFCNDKNCRLYNAHWQEELIFAQLNRDYDLCPHHQEIIDRLKNNAVSSTQRLLRIKDED